MNKWQLLILLFFLTLYNVNGNPYRRQIANLSKVKEMPYNSEISGSKVFWDAVICKKDIIPSLIKVIDSHKPTKARVHYFGGNYTVGDIAYHVIIEIIHDMPTLEFIKKWPKYDENLAFGNYWNFVRESNKNRDLFKTEVEKWYYKNEGELIWIEDKKMYLNEDESERLPHPSGGYYKLK